VKQNQPHPHVHKTYGAKGQYAKEPDDSVPLDKLGKKFIQEVTGVFLFHARAVDATMLTPLSALASEQAAPTERTMQKCLQFLDYAASQEEAILTYRASDMKLAIHSDASYLSEPKARSRAGGHMFLAGAKKFPSTMAQIKHLVNNKSSDVVGRRGRTRRIVHQRQNGRVHATYTRGIGTSTTTNSHPNRQLDRTRTTHQQDPSKGIKSHGHAIPLATMPRCAGPVSILLEARNTKLS
jgi:hypothetical protein